MSPNRRRLALVVAMGALLVLAGCGGGNGAPTDGSDAPNVNDSAVASEAVASIESVDSYRVDGNVTMVISANAMTQERTSQVRGAFDRANRELRLNQTITARGRSITVATYLVGETIYQHNPQYVQRFGASWIKRGVGDNFTRRWRLLDTMTRQRAILQNASVEVTAETTVDGTAAYVLEADVDQADFQNLTGALGAAAGDATVRDARFTYYLAKDSGRLLRSVGHVNTTATVRGRTIQQNVTFRLRFSGYGESIDITLPDAASTAVNISEEIGGSGSESSARIAPRP
ncbi:MAG: hypothetical protein ABEJ08_03525 [Halobacteriaceae archaeon]